MKTTEIALTILVAEITFFLVRKYFGYVTGLLSGVAMVFFLFAIYHILKDNEANKI